MASTTFIDNQTTIYAAWLNDVNNAVYNGNFVSTTLTAPTMICTGTASGVGFTNLINNTFSSPAAIGNTTPNTGAFTALTATSLTGLTTPLSIAQGGTGLSSAGTSGYILTSNGTSWSFALNPTIGVNQTWQDVTASRAVATTYTNSTGKPIQVNIQTSASSATGQLIVGGIVACTYTSGPSSWGIYTAIVPNGATYILSNSSALSTWSELR